MNLNKKPNICLVIFSSLSLVSLIIWIITIVLMINTNFNDTISQYNTVLTLSYIIQALLLTSIIGTFVTSIICLAKSKHFTKKGLIKGSGIVGIVGSSLGLIFCIIGFTSTTLPLIIGIILLIITFGLGIGALKSIDNQINEDNSLPTSS